MVTYNKTKSPNQSLARALSILELFSSGNVSWGIRDLARQTESDPATIYRTLSTLCQAGYLEKNPISNRYNLGPRFLMMASSYIMQNPIQEVAQKVFQKHSQYFEHNFYLGKIFENKVVYVTVLEGHGPLKISVSQGLSTELYCTALGKVILAIQDNTYIEYYLKNVELKAYTKNTITDPQALMDNLYEIRSLGYALNHGERHEDVGSVGVPLIHQEHQKNLAVSLAYPQHLVNQNKLDLKELIQIAKTVSNEIAVRASMISMTS